MLSDMNRRNEAVSQACHDAFLCAPFGRVWQALRMIPSGKVLSYGELALRLGSGARYRQCLSRQSHPSSSLAIAAPEKQTWEDIWVPNRGPACG
jgi:hypothetical protein